jgi:hypothetical protein
LALSKLSDELAFIIDSSCLSFLNSFEKSSFFKVSFTKELIDSQILNKSVGILVIQNNFMDARNFFSLFAIVVQKIVFLTAFPIIVKSKNILL